MEPSGKQSMSPGCARCDLTPQRAACDSKPHVGSSTVEKNLAAAGINAGDAPEADVGGEATAEVAPDEENVAISQDDDDGEQNSGTVSRENFRTAAPFTALQHDAIHHGVAWDVCIAVLPVNGSVLRRPWIVAGPVGQQIVKGQCSLEMNIVGYLFWMFPQCHLGQIVEMTSQRLPRKKHREAVAWGALLVSSFY